MGGFDRMDDLNRDGELSTFERETRDYNRYLELSGDNTMDDNSFISDEKDITGLLFTLRTAFVCSPLLCSLSFLQDG